MIVFISVLMHFILIIYPNIIWPAIQFICCFLCVYPNIQSYKLILNMSKILEMKIILFYLRYKLYWLFNLFIKINGKKCMQRYKWLFIFWKYFSKLLSFSLLDGTVLPMLLTSSVLNAFSNFTKSSDNFPCPCCSKSFKSNQLLKQHLNLHTPNLLYCHLCDASFKWRSSKWSHMRRYHPNETGLKKT